MLERDLATTLAQSLPLAKSLAKAISNGAPPAAAIDRLLGSFDEIRASRLLLGEEHSALRTMLGAATAVDRHDRVRARMSQRLDDLARTMDRVAAAIAASPISGDATAALDALIRELERSGAVADRAPLGVTLPVRAPALPQAVPDLPAAIVPAYADPTVPPPAPADAQAGPEVTLSDAIRAQALALHQNPIELFEFVRNQSATQFYYGAMKGAEATLAERAGNDLDQASLLIALMRASGIPARYVRGVIALTGAQAMAWTGMSSPRRVAATLTAAGIPFRPIRAGGAIAAFEVEHIWVEVHVPYGNYRGVPLDSSGRAWIPLDPSFKVTKAVAQAALPDSAGFAADAVIAAFLSTPQSLAAVAFITQALVESLAQSGSPLTVEQITMHRSIEAVTAGLLPSTLPYSTVTVNHEFAAVPESLRHQVRFTAGSAGSAAFDVTIPASDLVGQRLTLSYIPATVEDHVTANAFLSLGETPAYLVDVRPVLKIGGVARATGEDAVAMGSLQDFAIEIRSPRATHRVANAVVAGGYFAIGLSAGATAAAAPAPASAADTEGAGGASELHRLAIDYLNRWNAADEAIAGLLHVAVVRPMLSEVMVGGFYRRTVLLGEATSIAWRGLFVDADSRTADAVPVDVDDRARVEFLRLSGVAGAALEAKVLRDNLDVAAVSAPHLIQLAHAAGIPVRSIDAGNVATLLPALQTAEQVTRDVADAVNQGWRVTIPQSDFAHGIWTGIGYIVGDPSSGEAGYFISGGLAGGATADDPNGWARQELADWLEHPYNPADDTNTSAGAAASIHKFPLTDRQKGTAGANLPDPLAVMVRDASGRAVKDARVTFKVLAGNGSFAGDAEATAVTNFLGVAKATLTLGKKTIDAPFFVKVRQDDLHLTQVGENIVTATVEAAGGTVALAVPFQLFGYPGAPHHIVKVAGDGNRALVATASGTIRARIADAHDNPLSNLPLTFAVLPGVPIAPNTNPLPETAKPVAIYPADPACANPHPILGECGGVSQLTIATSSIGASVETILGNTSGTEFRVQATHATLPPQVFSLFSDGARSFTGEYVAPRLAMSILHLVSEDGGLLAATKIGTEYRRPLSVALLLVEDDDYWLESTNEPCPAPADPCFRVRSRGTTRVRPITATGETATVTFTPTEGGGTVIPSALSAPEPGSVQGRYSTRLTVGADPALNVVEMRAQATVRVPSIDLHAGTLPAPLAPVVVKAGQQVDNVHSGPSPPAASGTELPLHHRVFGLRARFFQPSNPSATRPSPVFVGSSGGTIKDFSFGFVIEPPQYVPHNVDVHLLRTAPGGGGDEFLKAYIAHKVDEQTLDGIGTAPMHQGTALDPSDRYRVEVVVNPGTEAEVRSSREPLDAYLVAPLGVDFRSRTFSEAASRRPDRVSLEGRLLGEKARVAGFISKGLARAAADCPVPIATMGLSMIEQGSGACFWSPNFQTDPVGSCAAFQSGKSDHDFEVLIPDAHVAFAGCLTGALNAVAAEESLARLASGEVVGDVTFFAVAKNRFQSGVLGLDIPDGGGADTLGDLGLGRQTLLLKWLLEGEYVAVPPLAQPGQSGTESLAAILEKLRTTPIFAGETTGIPRLEAYEIGLRERFNFYKTRAHFRLAGSAAVDPKSFLFEQQQNALRGGAKAAIRATLGRLLASAQGQALLFITRDQYRGGGCVTATSDPSRPEPLERLGVKACDSFEEHIASAAVRSVLQGLDLFTPGEVQGQIYDFFRLKANPACASDDCRTRIMSPTAANELLQLAILFVRNVESRTRDLFNQTLPQDPRAAQRIENLTRASTQAEQAQQSGSLGLESRVFNSIDGRFEFVPLDLFRGSTLETPHELTTVEPTSERIVDVHRDGRGNPVPGEDGRPQPVFRPPVGAGATTPFTLVLDRFGTIRKCDTRENAAGFFVYTLNEGNPDPPALAPAPPLPVPFPPPPPECADNLPPSLTLSKLVNGQPDIAVAPATRLTVSHTITNTSPSVVRGIVLDDRLLNRTYGPFTLPAGASRTVEDVFTPTEGGLRLIGPTEVVGFAADDRIARTWDSVAVDVTRAMCSARVVPLDPDPNPYLAADDTSLPALPAGAAVSRVMVGGRLFRHYRVFDAAGHPARSATLSLVVNGQAFDARTDNDGYVIHEADGEPRRGLEVQAAWLGTPTDPPVPLVVRFVAVNGRPSVCAQPFWAVLLPREFTQALKGGTSIKLEGALATLSLNGKSGYGVDLAIKNVGAPKTFTFGRNMNLEVGAGIKGTAAKGRVKLIGEASLASAEAAAGFKTSLAIADEHRFDLPLDRDRALAVAELLLSTYGLSVSQSIPGGPVLGLILNELFERLTSLDSYRSAVGTSMGISVSGNATANGPTVSLAETGIPGLEGAALGIGATAGVSAGITAGFRLSPLEHTFSTSVDYRGEANLSGGLRLGAAALEPILSEDGEELDFVTKAIDTLKFELNGAISGNVTFTTTIDTAANPIALKRLDVAVSGKKGFGYKLPLTQGVPANINAEGSTDTTKFSVTDPQKLAEAVERVTLIQALAAVPIANVLLGPDFLGSQIAELTNLYDGYERNVESGNGIQFGIGAGAFAEGTGIDADLSLKLDNSVSYAIEKGSVRKAGRYKLESYPADDDINIPSPAFESVPLAVLENVLDVVKDTVADAFTHIATAIVPDFLQPLTLIAKRFSPSGVDLAIQNAAESTPFTVDLVAYKYRPTAGPVAVGVQDPTDAAGPADRPHYGVGGFFNFAPLGKRLAAPAALTIYYLDEEVVSFDERTLAIYAWNSAANDWERLGGTVDAAANSVTIQIARLGLFTVAPPMPRGTVAFTGAATSIGGAPPATAVTYSSSAIAMNTGGPVPDGTLFTVASLAPFASATVPFGSITTPDADPLTDGIQVPTSGGRIQFTVEYAAAAGSARIVAFPAYGTAFGEQLVSFP